MSLCHVAIRLSSDKIPSIRILYDEHALHIDVQIDARTMQDAARDAAHNLNALIKDYSSLIKDKKITYAPVDNKIPVSLVEKIKACFVSFSQEDLAQIARSVFHLISRNPLNAPNFSLNTAANARKIKNYIYHNLKIKLTADEVQHVLHILAHGPRV